MVEGNIDSCSCTFALAMVVGISRMFVILDIRKVEVVINVNVGFSACQSNVLEVSQGNGERVDYSVSLCSNVLHRVRMIVGSSDFRVVACRRMPKKDLGASCPVWMDATKEDTCRFPSNHSQCGK